MFKSCILLVNLSCTNFYIEIRNWFHQVSVLFYFYSHLGFRENVIKNSTPNISYTTWFQGFCLFYNDDRFWSSKCGHLVKYLWKDKGGDRAMLLALELWKLEEYDGNIFCLIESIISVGIMFPFIANVIVQLVYIENWKGNSRLVTREWTRWQAKED